MVARKNAGKSPEQLRHERAVTEYHSFKFRLETLVVRYKDGDTRRAPVVYVSSPSGSIYTVAFEADGARCNCEDAKRRGQGCKHSRAAAMFVNGEPPEPIEGFVAGLPVPFDVDVEGALLASLEAQEQEREDMLRTPAEESCSFARGFLAGCGIDARPQDPALRDRELLWPAA